MHRCSDPLCGKVIDSTQSCFEFAGSVYCSRDCRTSWEMANVALLGAADPFRKTPMAALYGRPQSGRGALETELR